MKHFHFASVGFQPAGQHLSATNAKSSQSDRSPSDSSGGSNVSPNQTLLPPSKLGGELEPNDHAGSRQWLPPSARDPAFLKATETLQKRQLLEISIRQLTAIDAGTSYAIFHYGDRFWFGFYLARQQQPTRNHRHYWLNRDQWERRRVFGVAFTRIESRQVEGKAVWCMQPLGFTWRSLQLLHNGKKVWEGKELATRDDSVQTTPYITTLTNEIRP